MEQAPIPANPLLACQRFQQDERRIHPRLPCKGIVELRILPIGDKQPATLLDLSATGCRIEASAPFPDIGLPCVEVHLRVKGFSLRLGGVVRHVEQRVRAGVQFIDLTSRKTEQITELINALIEMENEYYASLSR